MSVRVEQMTLTGLLPENGGSAQHAISEATAKTRKPKQSTKDTSKYKVNANGITIKDVVDYISPSEKDNVWVFVTSDDRRIVVSGNVVVEQI